jgi:hypothetical protein
MEKILGLLINFESHLPSLRFADMLRLDDRITAALDTTASAIASGSAFIRAEAFVVERADGLPFANATAGRFLSWEVDLNALRIAVSLDVPLAPAAHISLGTIDAIQESQRPAFLQAVQAAFPITEASTFTTSLLLPPAPPMDASRQGTAAPSLVTRPRSRKRRSKASRRGDGSAQPMDCLASLIAKKHKQIKDKKQTQKPKRKANEASRKVHAWGCKLKHAIERDRRR